MTRVMVVDEEPDVKMLFQHRFRAQIRDGSLSFAYALSSEEALGLLERDGRTDVLLILSDIDMPGMPGLELLRAVKARFPAMRVGMFAADDDDEARERAAAAGADMLVEKPLNFGSLTAFLMVNGMMQPNPPDSGHDRRGA